jgi:predicted porin
MKKTLIAMAVMAAAGAASAQSSVTLFGIVDATISHYSVGGGQHNTILTNSGYNSSRLGFRGTEDLGGGMAASFWLEAGLNNDNGSNGTTNTNNTLGGSSGGGGLTFGRRATVSLSGGWGELRLGRDYVPTFWNTTIFDPFGTNGVGTTIVHKAKTTTLATTLVPFANVPGLPNPTQVAANDPNAVRASNMVGYFLPPNLGGIYGQVNYAFSEVNNPSGGDAGRFWGARLGYGSGPFNVAIAYGKSSGSDTFTAATALQTSPDVSDWNIGGQWDFGMAKLMAEYDHSKLSNGFGVIPDSTLKGWLIGALVPVGAGEIRASYSRTELDIGANPRADQFAIGYVHNLSKRTALYATYARLKNHDGANMAISASLPQSTAVGGGVVNSTSSGFDLGIRHSF